MEDPVHQFEETKYGNASRDPVVINLGKLGEKLIDIEEGK